MKKLTQFINLLSYPKDSSYLLDLKDMLGYLPHEEIRILQESYVETFDFSENSSLYLSQYLQLNENQKRELMFTLQDLVCRFTKDGELNFPPDYIPKLLDVYEEIRLTNVSFDKLSEGLLDALLTASDILSERVTNFYGRIFQKLSETLKQLKEEQLCLK